MRVRLVAFACIHVIHAEIRVRRHVHRCDQAEPQPHQAPHLHVHVPKSSWRQGLRQPSSSAAADHAITELPFLIRSSARTCRRYAGLLPTATAIGLTAKLTELSERSMGTSETCPKTCMLPVYRHSPQSLYNPTCILGQERKLSDAVEHPRP